MRMRKFITCFFRITMMLIFLQHQQVASLSRIHQKTALFRFNQSLTITTPTTCYHFSYSSFDDYEIPSHPKTMNWSMSSDHCTWEGVTCEHKTGDVIGLDLTCSQLEGAILPNSTLFQLSHLRFLNLSWNNFSLSNQFPQEFGFFAKGLTHLNLCNTRFSGRVPSGISHLYKLVSLDLTDYYHGTKLEDKVFKSLLQNLTQLRVLTLNWVNISSVLPMNLSTSLRVLNLHYTGLYGVLPQEVFHLPNLEVLDLSDNYDLTATLPKVKWGSSATLQHLSLGSININGGIPDSIEFLDSLTTLKLQRCNLSGPIPRSIGSLTQLTHLGLLMNNLNGPIPPWLFDLPSLMELDLMDNRFTSQLPEFDSSKSMLQIFFCRNNLLHGNIPQSFSQLVNLTIIDLSSNNFSGVLDFKMFLRLEYLEYLDLSHNSLSVSNISIGTLPPNLAYLGLASCKIKEFPFLSEKSQFSFFLDLSNNQIRGEIPNWIGLMNSYYLNLSHNILTGGLGQIPWNVIEYLDLQSNQLNGSLPTLICNSTSLEILNLSHNNLSGVLPSCPTNLTYLSVLDLRMNNIQGNIPPTISNFRSLETINLHGNKLKGRIPSSFAEFDSLQVLDLGNNQINDTFPQCLEALPNLQVLVLKSNKFHGPMNKSSMVEQPFPSLRIIDLSYNDFSGPLPTIYFRNFKAMMIGDGNEGKATYITPDRSTTAFYYSDSMNLVIKGVEFELVRILTVLTAIDVSRNNFEGEIPEYIGNLVSLIYLNLSQNHFRGHIPSSIGNLSMLESLDLSSNQLEGEIPRQLTSIYSLASLNLSYNKLSGRVPEGWQFNTFETDSYVGNFGLCGHPLSKKCEIDVGIQVEDEEDDDYFFNGFTWEAVVVGYVCGVVPAFITGYLMLLARKPKWFAGIIARELGLKIRRIEIKLL